MYLNEYLNDDLIFMNKKVTDIPDLFKFVSNILEEKDFVKDEFYENLLKRERNYPTGLQLDDNTIAIPHCNSEFVKKSFIFFIRLVEPIEIHRMDDPDDVIKTDLFFVLGLTDPKQHITLLQELMNVIQDSNIIENLKKATTKEEIKSILYPEIEEEQLLGNLKGGE